MSETAHTALTLARTFASEGGRVVLCHLRSTHPIFPCFSTDPQAPGLAERVRGTALYFVVIVTPPTGFRAYN